MNRTHLSGRNILATALLALCCMHAGPTAAQPAHEGDTIIVYNEEHPLVYEDAWDLWPYVFLNENGEPDGYNIDLLKMLLKELDIPYVVKLKPTLEAQKDLKNHKSDLMFRMDADFARNNSSYGKAIVQLFTHSIVTPKNKKVTIDKLSDLGKYKVYVHDGSFSHHYIKGYDWATNIIAIDDMKQAIQEVSSNENGVILWNTMSLKWLMQKYRTDNLKLSPFELPYGEYKFFSNDLHLLHQLDSVHSRLRASDRLTQIQNKWFYPEKKKTGIPTWIWNIIYALGAVATAFLLYYIIFKVREHKMTKEIRMRNERLSLILETSHVSFWTYNLATQTFTMMDKHGKPEESYKSLEFSQRYLPQDFERLTNALKQVIDEKVPTITLDIVSRDNREHHQERDYTITLSVLSRDKNNKPETIICSRSDITDDLLRHKQVKDNMLRYQSIFNTAMVDMVYYDEHGIVYNVNQKSMIGLGLTSEQIREHQISIYDVLGIKDFDVETMDPIYLTQIFTSKDDKRALNRLLKRDELYYEMQLIPIRDKEGKLLGIYGTGRDMTEVVRSYRQLKANTLQLQKINEEVTEYVNNIDYVLQVGGISMARYNTESHTLTIYSEIDRERFALTQTRALTFVAEESKKQALRLLNKMDNQQAGALHGDIKTLLHHNGGDVYLEFHFIPVYEGGAVKEYFGMCRDISELKAIEARLAQETLRAQEVEVVKNAFLHNMSHEIRTPLNSVVGFSELFQMDHSIEDEPVFIREIKESSASLLKLINDILFLSRLDAGMITITPRPIDFAAIFEPRCDAIWEHMKKPGVKYVTKNLYKRLVVDIDETNISVILDKILDNAVRYTDEGTVFVKYDYFGDKLVVAVEDTGRGISSDAIDHIFERFVTGANTGVGLGLSICHELTEYMGGRIQLTSEEGKGTTVWVTLPCKLIEMERI